MLLVLFCAKHADYRVCWPNRTKSIVVCMFCTENTQKHGNMHVLWQNRGPQHVASAIRAAPQRSLSSRLGCERPKQTLIVFVYKNCCVRWCAVVLCPVLACAPYMFCEVYHYCSGIPGRVGKLRVNNDARTQRMVNRNNGRP